LSIANNELTTDQSRGTSKTWLLDLPFDVVRLQEAVWIVHSAAMARRPLMLATPNVNFMALASRDDAFRSAVLDCDLFLADGMPIVWISKLTALPLPERVSGSSLFMELAKQSGDRPLRVFFFGGAEGVAERAARRISDLGAGLTPAGWLSPGFGDLEQLSADATIQAINDSGADLLMVAIGAKRGHEWMSRNRPHITVPVIAYLGATINFVAGTVRRAPSWVQRSGLEWLWRVAEEPSLASRYARDGLSLLSRLRREAWQRAFRSHAIGGEVLTFSERSKGNWTASGQLTRRTLGHWNAFLAENARTALTFDVSELISVDAAGLGALFDYLSQCRDPGARLVATKQPCKEIKGFNQVLTGASHPSIDMNWGSAGHS
jgi:N-acetylglucosaminyldiphosphoundecaprenol N-acetyl-beta-D-mannosaminyltransferase